MKQQYAQEWPQFFTATIQGWKHLLKEDKYKNIIVDSLKFLVTEGNVTINGFVIMPNNLHITCRRAGLASTSRSFSAKIELYACPSGQAGIITR